jgi:phosphoribosylformylglycinamidine cyclo-ligase
VLERAGGVEREEMYRVFNMGVGMIAVVGSEDVDHTLELLRGAGEEPWILGRIVSSEGVRWEDG